MAYKNKADQAASARRYYEKNRSKVVERARALVDALHLDKQVLLSEEALKLAADLSEAMG